MKISTLSIWFLILVMSLPLAAQEDEEAAPEEEQASAEDPAAPPPLPFPPKVTDDEVEPSVVIRREENKMIEEYSIDGRVYMVKITPDKGPPYYYLDEDGDGQLELQPGDEAMNPVRPVYWKVKEWK